MKRIKYLLPLILLLTPLTSCNNKVDKIKLDSHVNISSLVQIDQKDLLELINKKKDFLMGIGQKGCLTCSSILPTLIDYVEETKQIIYWIDIKDYLEAVETLKTSEDYSLNPMVETASLICFEKGKDLRSINYDSKVYSSLESLKSTLNNYLEPSNYVLVNSLNKIRYIDDISLVEFDYESTSTLDSLISENQNNTIMFTLTSCPDCKLLKESFLDSYLINQEKQLFVFQVDEVRTNEDKWNEFKVKYQFDSYRNGRVPSLVTYNQGIKKDMIVFVNDVIEKIDDNYIISESFFQDCLNIKGKTKEECMNKAKDIQIPHLEKYLKTYL